MLKIQESIYIDMQQIRSKIERPLSPHLGIYRWQISNSLSILHRLTGFGLFIGMIMFAWWIILSIYSPEIVIRFDYVNSVAGKFLLFCFSLAFFYHILSGIRHLFWDAGYGFEIKTMNSSGIFIVIAAVCLTLGSWIIALKLV